MLVTILMTSCSDIVKKVCLYVRPQTSGGAAAMKNKATMHV